MYGFNPVCLKFPENKNNQDDTAASSILPWIYSPEGTGSLSDWPPAQNQRAPERAAETPAQATRPVCSSDKTILNSLQSWLNYGLVFKITSDFFQKLSSPCFVLFVFTAMKLHSTKTVFRSPSPTGT